jgi:hypothetical protein
VVTVAMVHRKAVSELRENRFNQMIREAWDRILDYADSLKQTATT